MVKSTDEFDLLKAHARVCGAKLFQSVGDALSHAQIALALCPDNSEGDDVPAVKLGERASFLGRVGHLAQLVEANLASARDRDRGRGQPRDRARACERANGLLRAPDFATAACEVGIRGEKLMVDFPCRDAEREEPLGIERNANLALHPADSRNLGDPAHTLKLASHRVVDEPGQLLQRHRRRGRGIRHDRQALDIEALDDRLVDRSRQFLANFRDSVLDVVYRAIGIRAELELDDGLGRPVRDRGLDVLDVRDAGHRVLDTLGHLRFKLYGSGAGLRDVDGDDRNVDVRKARDRHVPKA